MRSPNHCFPSANAYIRQVTGPLPDEEAKRICSHVATFENIIGSRYASHRNAFDDGRERSERVNEFKIEITTGLRGII